MIRRLIIFIFCFLLSSSSTIESQPYDSNDFGFRFSVGTLSGIDDSIYPEISFLTDFYCFSSDFRMIFGPTFIFPTNIDIPTTVLHQIGLEYNISYQELLLVFGMRYYKSYIHDDHFEFDGGKHGMALLIGSKFKLSSNRHFLISLGWMDQVLTSQSTSSELLDSHHWQIKTGFEWYF